MAPHISAAFPPALDTPDHVKLAEDLGYQRAWLYDSPAYLHDVWMTLARAAERTERIGLGPAVLVPSLRHPMTNAAAIATLAELAPGRVAVAVGSGFTGRHMLGLRPMPWAEAPGTSPRSGRSSPATRRSGTARPSRCSTHPASAPPDRSTCPS
jgi:alkanesulfonate monooxygenase SsuD/methylene tetrahydromethanopterin reductase-like flavin-dependent oxidoreductase (luciferase family)